MYSKWFIMLLSSPSTWGIVNFMADHRALNVALWYLSPLFCFHCTTSPEKRFSLTLLPACPEILPIWHSSEIRYTEANISLQLPASYVQVKHFHALYFQPRVVGLLFLPPSSSSIASWFCSYFLVSLSYLCLCKLAGDWWELVTHPCLKYWPNILLVHVLREENDIAHRFRKAKSPIFCPSVLSAWDQDRKSVV